MPLRHLLSLALLLLASRLDAQLFTRPHLDWSTVETTHFVVHFPDEMRPWALEVVERLETVHEVVSAAVGFAPERRVTVIVEDPHNLSNGFAVPLLDQPVIFLFPTPPTPQSLIGNHRGWGELLAVHEYAHIAHLTRPSRNPLQRAVWRLLPASIGPVARRSPRWITEGYATYLEGQLTGSGRPNAAWRAGILRRWALDGRLPTYGQLDGARGFYGGSMAYLAGSAFLEWLVERSGEESLVHLWRRMSARQDRGFVEAFAGVFGDLPDVLYGRFTTELTGRALEVEGALKASGLVEGELVQRLTMRTGDPAISPDGRHIAIVIREHDRPSRIEVWPTEAEPTTEAEQRRRERLLERDPEDVPAIAWRPRPRRPVATLHPSAGRSHDNPRFLPDGRGILVTRPEALSDGTIRPDLYIWDFEGGRIRRVTHGAAIRHADPLPDGREAIADRCLNGICDLVRVDLETGDVRTLIPGSPTQPFYRPRVSRDGQRAAVSVQRDGGWALGIVDLDVQRVITESAGERFDATFTADGGSVVYVSDHGGILNLEMRDTESGATRTLTRVTGGVLAPAVHPATGYIYFLSLHSRGFDLRRLHPDSAVAGDVIDLPGRLAPALPLRTASRELLSQEIPEAKPYGLGPRLQRILPALQYGPEGFGVTAALHSSDPVGRLGWLLQGTTGQRGVWRGASLAAEYRAMRPWLGGQLWLAGQRPSAQRIVGEGLEPLDVDYGGAFVHVTLPLEGFARRARLRVGGSVGQVENGDDASTRRLALLELSGEHTLTLARWDIATGLALEGASGNTARQGWTRGVGSATLALARSGEPVVAISATHGVVSADAPGFEQMVLGGLEPAMFDRALLSQRIPMRALPFGVAGGEAITTWRIGSSPSAGPYFWAGRVEGGPWHRVWGADASLEVPPASWVTAPAVRVHGGIAYSVDAPWRRRVSVHVAVILSP